MALSIRVFCPAPILPLHLHKRLFTVDPLLSCFLSLSGFVHTILFCNNSIYGHALCFGLRVMCLNYAHMYTFTFSFMNERILLSTRNCSIFVFLAVPAQELTLSLKVPIFLFHRNSPALMALTFIYVRIISTFTFIYLYLLGPGLSVNITSHTHMNLFFVWVCSK